MAAPKGNQNAKGHSHGRPVKYTEEFIKEEMEAFYKWMEGERNIFFKSFAIERGYLPKYLNQFADKNIDFKECLEYAKAWQEQKLANSGLYGITNSNITKYVLGNCHSWYENQQSTPVTAKNSFDKHYENEVEEKKEEEPKQE